MPTTLIMRPHPSNVRAQAGSQPRPAADALQRQGDRDAGLNGPAFDLGQVPPAAETGAVRQLLQREPKLLSDGGEIGHAQRFDHAEHFGKPFVRHCRTDLIADCSDIPNMAEKPRKARHDLYPEYRRRSGWYLAAWRDFAGLTLEDLAEELSKSKGYVSDLETGAARPDRPPTRFNRDLVERVAEVVGTTGGRLIDVNPFEVTDRMKRLNEAVAQLDDAGQDAVLEMAERWLGRPPTRTGTDG